MLYSNNNIMLSFDSLVHINYRYPDSEESMKKRWSEIFKKALNSKCCNIRNAQKSSMDWLVQDLEMLIKGMVYTFDQSEYADSEAEALFIVDTLRTASSVPY